MIVSTERTKTTERIPKALPIAQTGGTLAEERFPPLSGFIFNEEHEMMDEFETAVVHTGETSIFVAMSGSGPPILLLHGFPQTHVMWREVAPRLSRDFRVVCADLRGYGRSGCPASAPDHALYAKRAMALDMVTMMERLAGRHRR